MELSLQRIVWDGHHRIQDIKFQSVVAPNCLVANSKLYGTVKGRNHDSGMLADSNLLPTLQQFCNRPNKNPLRTFGDLAYPLRPQL